MTKSTITRERLEQLADNNTICKVSWDERIELASMALAAMDSESGCLPLDYLQGHKDGLEWAAQLAEANHPETGYWLYDDPIELAKAIRKGPDMPPAQPAADSEPVAWVSSGALDSRLAGIEAVTIPFVPGMDIPLFRHPVVTHDGDFDVDPFGFARRGGDLVVVDVNGDPHVRDGMPLYRHAQPAPVVEREPIAWLNDAYLARGVVDGEAGSEDAGPGYIPVYREAGPQPAPVVPDDVRQALSKMDDEIIAELDAEESVCRAAMLPAAPVRSSMPDGVVTAEHRRVIEMLLSVCGAAFELADDSCQQDVDGEECHVVPSDAFQKLSDALDEIENTLPTEDIDRPDVFLAWSAMPRAALKSILQPGNSPAIPDGYVMVPMRLTAENGAKGALSGEFSETKFVNCPECFGDDECETCDGSGRIEITVPVTWTTIKEIWAKGVEHFAAAPQSPGGDHATVPGKWIPVSEHLPKEKGVYQVWNGKYVDNVPFWFGSFQSLHSELITHWMPLPAEPQEVK